MHTQLASKKYILPESSSVTTPAGPQLSSLGASLPASPEDVQRAVAPGFGDAVAVDGKVPIFVIGDSNGDRSQDLMVVVRPVGTRLPDINDELANWIIQNSRLAYVPPRSKSVIIFPPTPKPQKVQAGEPLLAVIHGFGAAGWRNPIARQALLLGQAAGQVSPGCRAFRKVAAGFWEVPQPAAGDCGKPGWNTRRSVLDRCRLRVARRAVVRGQNSSGRTRSWNDSRRRMSWADLPCTRTSAARGREL